ncbi:MAG: hypothetical protein WAP35_10580 [Solirubrobacterales bacterium]
MSDSDQAPPVGKRVHLSKVALPDGAQRPIEVFVNGVPQTEGEQYEVVGQDLLFFTPIKQEGKLGFLRWTSIFIGIAGTYRQNDSVDVTFERDGKRLIETGLPIIVLVESDPADGGAFVGSYSPGG